MFKDPSGLSGEGAKTGIGDPPAGWTPYSYDGSENITDKPKDAVSGAGTGENPVGAPASSWTIEERVQHVQDFNTTWGEDLERTRQSVGNDMPGSGEIFTGRGTGGNGGGNGIPNSGPNIAAGNGNAKVDNPRNSESRSPFMPDAIPASPPAAGTGKKQDDLGNVLTWGLPLWDVFWGKLEKLLEWAKASPLVGKTATMFKSISWISLGASIFAAIKQLQKDGLNFVSVSKVVIGLAIGITGLATGGTAPFIAGIVWTVLDATGVADWALSNLENLARTIYDGLVRTVDNIEWSFTEFLNQLRQVSSGN